MMTEGRQPCDSFNPRREANAYHSWDNVHECFGPFDANGHDPAYPMCAGKVSFCEACHRDHHSGGYETCPVPYRLNRQETT